MSGEQETVDLEGLVSKALEGINYSISREKGYVEVSVPLESLREAALRLKNAGFDHVKSLTIVDYIKKGEFKAMYIVSSYLSEELSGGLIALSTTVKRDKAKLPSLSDVWISLLFQEREVYEMFGIEFEGHPDLRLLLLAPHIAELKPLRKEFIVKEEPIIRKPK
ncbi:MAG: NADH-quinone oxidoreductase subunit C [Desulfurococcales archaeon]|nr:NADH-quinone oxidoreductase subunit C [Desulfurococcales archaeon]